MIQFVVKGRWNEESVASRMAAIVGNGYLCGDAQCPHYDLHAGKWQLDIGNDWFMNKVDDNKYELRYRYTTPERQEALNGLRLFLEFIFS